MTKKQEAKKLDKAKRIAERCKVVDWYPPAWIRHFLKVRGIL